MKAQKILINYTAQEIRAAIVEDGCLQEVHLERQLERGIVGNVYLGKVIRVLPGMQSAFIDIGLARTAFLHVNDLWLPQRYQALDNYYQKLEQQPNRLLNAKDVYSQPIEKQIYEGQNLLVQVIKNPIANKGARLTTQISIAGRLLVHIPQDQQIGISQRIEAEKREKLKLMVAKLAKQSLDSNAQDKTGGFILRTNAEQATQEQLIDDMLYLRKVWSKIQQQRKLQSAPSLLYAELSLAQRILRDLVSENTDIVQVDDVLYLDKLTQFTQEYMPSSTSKLSSYTGKLPIFDQYNIDIEIEQSLTNKVTLKSGGYLIIESTEALTSIDVNTGGFIGKKQFIDTVLQTNLEAAKEVARQLRLRNLGGIIVIDFIDMKEVKHQQLVLNELSKHLAFDRVKTSISEFSNLGLVEVARKRTQESLLQQMCENCPTCQGKARVKTVRSVAYEILREIEREAKLFNPKSFRVISSPEVAELLLDEEKQFLTLLSTKINKPIVLQSESNHKQEQFNIILV